MKLTKLAILAISAALPVMAAESASAAVETFDWTLTGPDPSLGGFSFTGSGTLTATSTAGAAWDVTSVSGEVGGKTITGLTSFFIADNIVFPDGLTQISTNGFAFEIDGGVKIDIFSFYSQGSTPSGNAYGEETSQGFGGVGHFSMTAVPEPATWAMMGLGFAGVAFLGYRRAKPSLAA